MKRAAIVLALLSSLVVNVPALGCSYIAWDPNDVVGNPRFDSANRRFTLVARLYPQLGDFEMTTQGALADQSSLFTIDELEAETSDPFIAPEGYEPYLPEDPLDRLPLAPWLEPEPDDDSEPEPL